MTSCPETHQLLSLGNAAEWRLDLLQHVGGCDTCRSEMATLAALRTAIDESDPVREGFTESVMASLDVTPPPARWVGWLSSIGLPVVVACTSLVVLHASGGIDPSRSASAALIVGIAAAIVEHRRYRTA